MIIRSFILANLGKVQITHAALVFHETFENLENWQHDVTFDVQNNEFQYYRNDPKNSYLQNNILTINPTLTVLENGNDAWFLHSGTLNLDGSECSSGCSRTGYWDYIIPPVQSAKITTRQSFSFRYGKVEFEAKLPNGDWLWPAVWMMPKNDVYGGWPRSGEIDILEARSNEGLDCNGNESGRKCAVSTLHYGKAWNEKSHFGGENCLENGDFGDGFHKYELYWNETGIYSYIDGNLALNRPAGNGFCEGEWWCGSEDVWAGEAVNAPFDQEFYSALIS